MISGKFLKRAAKTALKGSVPAANILVDFSDDDWAEANEALLVILCRLSDQMEALIQELRGIKEQLDPNRRPP